MFYSRPKHSKNANNHGNSNLTKDQITPLIKQWWIEYFLLGPSIESDKKACTEITKQLQREFEDVFTGIECFDGMFSLQVKPDSKPCQAPPWCIAYALQKPFKEELGRIQQQGIITPSGIDEIRWNGGMEQQLHTCTKAQWKSKAMPTPFKTQPSTYKGWSIEGPHLMISFQN